MTTPKHVYLRLSLILLIYFLLASAHSIWLPLHKAPDEQAHFRYISFIADAGRLPLTFEERAMASYRANQPALYHSLVALSTGWSKTDAPPYLKFVWQSPRFDMIKELLDTKRLANTEDELWPFRGVIFAWHLARFVGLILSMGTIVAVFFTALEISPRNYWLALVSAAIIAFLPIFIFTSSALSDDTLVGLLLGLYFWILVKLVKGDTRLRNYILLGLLMGLAVTTKNSTIILPIEVVGVFAYLAWKGGWGWLNWLKRTAIVATAAIIASSWWYLTIIIYFNDIDTFGPVVGILKPLLASGVNASERYVAYILSGGAIGTKESAEFLAEPWSAWALNIYQSFWVKDIIDFPLGPIAQILIGLVCVVAAVGLAKVWRFQPDKRVWVMLFLFHLILFFIFPALRHTLQGNVSQTGQGRHVLFPVATVLPLLLTYGWQGWLSRKTQRRLALALIGGLLCWSMAQLIRVIDYPLLYLPVQTTKTMLAIPDNLQQPFGENISLSGHSVTPDPGGHAIDLELYWQSSSYVEEDYQMTIALLQQGEPVFSWTQYPVNGRYPTRIWESWETIRDDIRLPLTDLPPGDYQLQIQLQGVKGPLQVGEKNAIILDEITVLDVAPPAPEISIPVTVADREVIAGVSLWQADKYRRDSSALPEYRPRMQIPFVWQGQPASNERVQWLLVDPVGNVYPTISVSDHFEYFPVGLDWLSGDYRLRAEVWNGDSVVASREIGPVVSIVNKRPRLLDAPPISYPVEANFANGIKLLGYDLPQRSLPTGSGGVPITLYWQGQRTMDTSYTVFSKLLNVQQEQWGNAERLPADGYDTIYWFENEVVIDGFELPIDPNTPDGIYWINLGMYQKVNNTAQSIPLLVNDQPGNETSLTLGPLKIGDSPREVVLTGASPQHMKNADFSGSIRLLGFDEPNYQDNTLRLKLYWQSLQPVTNDYTVFVHIRNQSGETVAQMDSPPAGGRYPTSIWSAGEIIGDEIFVPVPDSLPAGEYTIVVGLYNFDTGTRLNVENSADNSVLLTSLTVE